MTIKITTLKEKLENMGKPYYDWRSENDLRRLLCDSPIQDLFMGLAEDAGYDPISIHSLPLPDDMREVNRYITALLIEKEGDNPLYKF